MHPVLFTIGPITLYTYGAMMVVAFLAATGLAVQDARTLPREWVAIAPEQLMDFACVSLLGGVIGGRLLYVGLQWDAFLRQPLEMPAVWHGGLVWYGGLFGGLLGGWLYVRRKRLAFLRVMDQFIPFGALGHAIGRVGCFLNGCCYGRPTDAWYGVTFPGHAHPVIPTQLIEAGALTVLYGLLRRMRRPRLLQYPGRVFGWYLVSYAVLRFLIEFLRGDQTALWAGLTLQQLVSGGVFAAGLYLIGLVKLRTAS